MFETQGNDKLAKACEQAIANRTSENEASHALVHRSLIAARLKDSESLSDALVKLMNHKIRYDSLMTRNRATVTELKWSNGGKKISAVITSDIDQKLNVSAKGKTQNVTFKAGESKTIIF